MRATLEPLRRHLDHNLLPWTTVCYMVGATLAFKAGLRLPPFSLTGPATLILLLLATLFHRRGSSSWTSHAGMALFILLGLILTDHALQGPQSPSRISRMIRAKTRVTVMGTICSMIQFDGEKSSLLLKVEEVLLPGDGRHGQGFRPTRGTIRMSVGGWVQQELQPGDRLMAVAYLSPIRNYQTPGAFDYRSYMAEKGIYLSGWVSSPAYLLPVDTGPKGLIEKIRWLPERIRQHTARFLAQRLDQTRAALFQALLIGERRTIPPALLEQFKAAGCMHLLAISGLHLGLLGAMAALTIKQLAGRSTWLLLHTHVPTLALGLTFPLLLGYSFIAGMNTPVLRALLMAMLALYGLVVRRQKDLIHLIAAAALLVLVISPLALATASFQLSFSAVLAIALITPKLWNRPPENDRSAARRLLQLLFSLLAVSSAATLGTMPLMLYHFNRFSLLGPLMNLIIEPLLCFWALPAGLVAIPLSYLAPQAAEAIFNLGGIALWIARSCLAGIQHLPIGSVWTITPHPLEICLFFTALALILIPKSVRRPGLVLGAACLLLCLGSFTRGLWAPPQRRVTTVHYLDVGQGSATVLFLTDGNNILIDGGGASSTRSSVGQRVIAPFLRKMRVWRLEGIIISHPDGDHYNGIPFLLEQFPPRQLYINGHPSNKRSYQALLTKARQEQIPIMIPQSGTPIAAAHDYTLSCLGMNGVLPQDRASSSNDSSLVVELRQRGWSLLFPADISRRAEVLLLRHHPGLHTDILQAGHHGSITSSGLPFLKALSPRLIVVSAGIGRQGTHPHQQNLETWQEQQIEVLITARDGTISSTIDRKRLQVSTFSGRQLTLPARALSPATHLTRESAARGSLPR
ncbi:DNA internalization-related competence protein ComEC/Rec2 [Desulfogranum mediterraneum]|uniref:DNA internalization-related competence protein ComEC/Rec2 n=1 Tax=Desulfogranum mediterraneum TaxID=160661 RepID=UPI0003F9816C|nr:DNA internalization-related competence protein ComEC/Rec2 [Desulfogranum mediterraneum]